MATKLYPPYIEGTLPAFYLEYDGSKTVITGATITVPFLMNLTVSEALIKGFSLRLRTASSGSYLFSPIFSSNYDTAEQEVYFHLTAKEAQLLNEGQYYKVQIAYCGSAQTDILGNTTAADIGFYSTVGVIKCTSLPKVSINNLEADSVNFFTNDFVGMYDQSDCKDLTEKVYSYEFIVYDEFGELCYTTGELLHHSYYDTEYNFSIDKVSINNFIPENSTYSIQYKVTTINNLLLYTSKYRITNDNLISPNEDIKIIPVPDNDNGIINITFKGENDENKSYYFVLDTLIEEIANELNNIDAKFLNIKSVLIDYFKNNSTERITKLKANSLYKYTPDENNPGRFYYVINENDKNNEKYQLLGKLRNIIKNLPYSAQKDIDFNRFLLIHEEPYEKFYYGSYLLSRADDSDNYSTWINIVKFRLDEQRASSYSIKDFTIEHGRKYKYALLQYNIWGLYSARFYSAITEASFEDMYLYDGEKTLKIRYNPEVSSFKTTLLESKSNTIGGRFPYITRNGETYYKEFPIGGLLAQELDVDNSFTNFYYGEAHRHSTSVLQNDIPENALRDPHMFSDTNIALEREFKLNVLEWLNNGKPKLFKSPYEGNYIVRLMLVSLNPIKELGRMLHNFTSTAYEIAEFSYENLVKFGFIKAEAPSDYVGMWRTYNFMDYEYGKDIEIVFDANLMAFTVLDMTPGDIIKIKYYGESEYQDIMIGITGSYSYIGSDKAIVGIVIPFKGYKTIGTLNCYYRGVRITAFDSVIGMELKTVVSLLFIGTSPWVIDFKKNWTSKIVNHEFPLYDELWQELLNYNLRDELAECTKLLSAGNFIIINGKEDEFGQIIAAFEPHEILNRINTTLYNGKVYKVLLLNIELARFRLREVIPIYAFNDNEIVYDSSKHLVGEKKSFTEFKDQNNKAKEFLVSTSPYGYPHPIEELSNFEPIDPYAIFEVYFKNSDLGNWSHLLPVKVTSDSLSLSSSNIYYRRNDDGTYNKIETTVDTGNISTEDWNNKIKPVFNEGRLYKMINDYHYYDPYYRTWLTEDYDPTFTIVTKDNTKIREVSLATIKEKFYKDEMLKNVTSIKIGNGVIAELTYQTKIIDYYTEINNAEVRAAKEEYLEALNLHLSLVKSYATIATSDYERLRNRALMRVYYDLLHGAGSAKLTGDDRKIIEAILVNNVEKEKLYFLNLYNITYINKNLDIDIVDKLLNYKELHNTENKFGFNDNLLIYQAEDGEMYFLLLSNINAFILEENTYIIIEDYNIEDYLIYRLIDNSDEEVFFALPNDSSIPVGIVPYYYLGDDKKASIKFIELNDTNTDILIQELGAINKNDLLEAKEELLNKDELLITQTNEYYIDYKLVEFVDTEETPITFYENKSIEDIIADKPTLTEGVESKLNAINELIDRFNQEINALDETRNTKINEYIEAYTKMITAIDEYNNNVYISWSAYELKEILENLNPELERNDIINMFNKVQNEASELVELLEDDINSYIEASKEIYDIALALLKNLSTYEKITGDKSNDKELDDYLINQTLLDRGELIFNLYNLKYYYDYIQTLDENNAELLTIQNYINYIINHIDISDEENKDNFKLGIAKWLENIESQKNNLMIKESSNIEAVGEGKRGAAGLNNIILLSIYYDDLKLYLIYLNYLNDTFIDQIKPNNIDEIELGVDPLTQFENEIKLYTTNNITEFNRKKETYIYKYRQRIKNSSNNLNEEEEELINPSNTFLFNPYDENKKDSELDDNMNNMEYYEGLNSSEKLIVALLHESLISNILEILNNLGSKLTVSEMIDMIEDKYLKDNRVYNINNLNISREDNYEFVLKINNLLLEAYDKLEEDNNKISIKINGEMVNIREENLPNKVKRILIERPETSRDFLLIHEDKAQSFILDDNILTYCTKVINNILDTQGIYYEYLQLNIVKDISEFEKLLELATILFNLYSKQYNNYSNKYKQYLNDYEMYQSIYDTYNGTPALEFYDDKDSNKTLEEISMQAKLAYWKYLNLLDYYYTDERERGMYR